MTRSSFLSGIGFRILSIAAVLAAPLAHGAAASPTVDLLDRAGQRAKKFWDELSSVACTESVLQEKLDRKGKVVLNSRGDYDYLISLRWDSGGMLVDESRLMTSKPQKKAPQGVLLSTQGFATLLMIFHPEFQPSYTFTLVGEETIAGRKLARVDFLPRNGAPSPAVLAVKGRDFPIAWEGTAWIDPDLAMITRLEAHWRDPAPEIGLEALSSEVLYSPVSFRGETQPTWLPETARIEVTTLHQHWRNTHRFSNYRRFAVETQTKIGESKQ